MLSNKPHEPLLDSQLDILLKNVCVCVHLKMIFSYGLFLPTWVAVSSSHLSSSQLLKYSQYDLSKILLYSFILSSEFFYLLVKQ